MTAYTATIEKHRQDYMGVLSRPFARRTFKSLEAAKVWSNIKLNEPFTFSVIEGTDDSYTTSSNGLEWD